MTQKPYLKSPILVTKSIFYSVQFNWKIHFKYSCQPNGYISEGEDTIDPQSIESATLQMITFREIH